MHRHSLELSISNTFKVVFKSYGCMVILPTISGEIGVLYDHVPIITSLKFGLIKLLDETNNIMSSFYIDSGVAQVNSFGVQLLCQEYHDASEVHYEKINEKIQLLSSLGSKDKKLAFYQKILTTI